MERQAKAILESGTASGAAMRFYQWLKRESEKLGGNPNEVKLRNGSIVWEMGPFEWAVALLGGSSMYAGEFGSYSTPGPFPNGITSQPGSLTQWHAECDNSFAVTFYSD